MKHYIIICEYVIDWESGVEIIGVKHTYDEALEVFKKQLEKEKENAESNGYEKIEESAGYFSAYIDGSYCTDHITLYIEETEEEK